MNRDSSFSEPASPGDSRRADAWPPQFTRRRWPEPAADAAGVARPADPRELDAPALDP